MTSKGCNGNQNVSQVETETDTQLETPELLNSSIRIMSNDIDQADTLTKSPQNIKIMEKQMNPLIATCPAKASASKIIQSPPVKIKVKEIAKTKEKDKTVEIQSSSKHELLANIKQEAQQK